MKRKINVFSFIILIAIVFFSFFRVYKLGQIPASLFSDEVDIGYQIKSLLSTGKDYQGHFLPLQLHSFSDVRTALPIYTTALVSLVPGISIDLAIRLTPVIFSILGIIGIYLFTNSIFSLYGLFDKQSFIDPGLLSAFILSAFPWHFTYSRTGFELSMLFAFFVFGLFFLIKHLQSDKIIHLILAFCCLSFLPLIYSTAKLALLLLPLLFLTLPGFIKNIQTKSPLKIFIVFLFIPLVIVILNGGASQRFSEIAIFTDPTIPTQINYLRQLDLGKNLVIGSSPSISSKIAHNKPLSIVTSFSKNLFGPISTSFLFSAGDPNLRHSVPGWGMALKIFALFSLIGIYIALTKNKKQFLLLLLVLVLLSIVPSALTRDGATHSSRTFLLILPFVLISTLGLYLSSSKKIAFAILLMVMLFESSLYFHDYFFHYPILSERDFHAGLKELVKETNKYPDRTVVLTRTYEPSLIFFLYYTNFPPEKAHLLIPQGKLTESISGNLNLEGVKISGTNIYLAGVLDSDTENPLLLKDAIYVLPAHQAAKFIKNGLATKMSDIFLPSGELMYTVITPIKIPGPNTI